MTTPQRGEGLRGGSSETPGFSFSMAGGAVSGSIAILGSTLGESLPNEDQESSEGVVQYLDLYVKEGAQSVLEDYWGVILAAEAQG